MKILKIKIKNFKKFKEKDFEFNDSCIIVGNNDVGKSTVLEAVNLALSGTYHGRNIVRELNSELFNSDVVNEYITKSKDKDYQKLPKLCISVYFDNYPEFRGLSTPDGSEADGFTFSIEFDDKYKKEYGELVEEDNISSLPIEYYKARWYTFSHEDITLKKIPLKALMVDSNNFYSNSVYTSRIIKEFFDETASVKMSQAQRKAYDQILNDEVVIQVNKKIKANSELANKGVTVGISNITKSSWTDIISTKINQISFENTGKGEQSLVKTYLSFSNDSIKNKGIILIEEPEAHLSFANLNKLLSFINTKFSDYQVIITTHSSFVLNKLGLDKLLLMSNNGILKISSLDDDTVKFFEKKNGYDTLRLILSDKTILVEGDSDELIVQKAYLQKNGRLPINDGIDIMSVGLSFKRFLQIADKLKLTVSVVTDNDGDLDAVQKKFKEFSSNSKLKICYSTEIHDHDKDGISREQVPNINTLEPELLRANSLKKMNNILGCNFDSDEKLLHFMITNKTEVAWLIFKSQQEINYPKYIEEAIS